MQGVPVHGRVVEIGSSLTSPSINILGFCDLLAAQDSSGVCDSTKRAEAKNLNRHIVIIYYA